MNAKPDVNNGPLGLSRVLGVYPQKQSGLFMQRIKLPGGRINWRQWRTLAKLATAHCAGAPLHLTTRQDIELHNIRDRDVAAVQQGLTEVALATYGACGDCVRNVTVCPDCDFRPDGLDVMPLARLVRQTLEQQPVSFTLPRKFKISFSGCPQACAKPWLNDLGFIAQGDGRFIVIGAGSLGPKPALGVTLYEDLSSDDVLPLCTAAVEFFEQHGDRENRRRARLRHIRERFGDDAFKAALDRRLAQIRVRQSWPGLRLARGRSDVPLQARLQLTEGNILPVQAVALADAAEPAGAVVRVNLEHGVNLYGPSPILLPEDLAAMAAAPAIVACPGNTTCPRGLADCPAAARRIREALVGQDQSNVRIHISGCPNGCAHSAAASIGLVGLLRKTGDRPTPHFRLLTGGGNGQNNVLAEPGQVVPADLIPEFVKERLP